MQRVKVTPMEHWREGAGAGHWVWAGSPGGHPVLPPSGDQGGQLPDHYETWLSYQQNRD